jgi:predicted ester cyclase
MSAAENKEFIRRYLDAVNGKPKPENVLRLFVAEEALLQHIQATEAGMPLYRVDAEEIIAEGDLVTVRGRGRGVHNGTLMGVPPTGKELDIALFITYKIQDGKIVDHWMLTDNMAMMQQLGLMPVQG